MCEAISIGSILIQIWIYLGGLFAEMYVLKLMNQGFSYCVIFIFRIGRYYNYLIGIFVDVGIATIIKMGKRKNSEEYLLDWSVAWECERTRFCAKIVMDATRKVRTGFPLHSSFGRLN